MGAPVIIADMLAKAYGGRRLFEDAVFQIEEGDRVAIVGPNGAGKSTLLRIMAGRESTDSGRLRLADGLATYWFEQHPVIPEGASVRELLAARLPVPAAMKEKKARLDAEVADPGLYERPGYESVLAQLAAVEREIEQATEPPKQAWDSPFVRSMGFGARELDQSARSLSGGERTRLMLARTLGPARSGGLVVLDEPTNHLDLDTIEWLEDWISAYDGTVLVVAHDRAFLDNVATKVLAVERERITLYPGNYEDYAELKAQHDAEAERERVEAKRAYDETKATIMQFRHQKRFDGQYGSRMKMLERYKQAIDRTPDPVLASMDFGLAFDEVAKSSREVLHADGLTKRYDGKAVLFGADFEVLKGDRIGLVGRNGAGKTTLLRLMTGQEETDAGTVRAAPAVRGCLLSQTQDGLDPERTCKEEVLDARESLDDDAVKALLGRFRLRPEEDMERKVGTLSGGERARLALLKAVMKPSNLLVLDEPTNHLDIEAREVLARALNAYKGTLLVVSHDRWLLDSVTNKTAVVRRGQVEVFPSAYTDARPYMDEAEKRAAKKKAKQAVATAAATAAASGSNPSIGNASSTGGVPDAPAKPKGPRYWYVVIKKFDDGRTGKRYRVDDEVGLSNDEIEGSHALRNAVAMGWLEKKRR